MTTMATTVREAVTACLGVTGTLVALGPASTVLVVAMVVGYIALVAGAPPEGLTTAYLLSRGGDNPDLVLQGQVWRLVTSAFLHGGPLHLALNALATLFVGALLNREFGSGRFLALYAAGVVSGGISLAALGGHDIVSVGASGGVFAMAGTLVVLAARKHPWTSPRTLMVDLPLMAATSFVPGVDWRSHLGGFVVGVLLGLSWTRGDWKPAFSLRPRLS